MEAIGRVEVEANRSLINARFEGYKLATEGSPAAILQHPLGAPVQLQESNNTAEFSFKKLQRRAGHNRLSVSPFDPHAVYYVDAAMQLTRVALGAGPVQSTVLFTMPRFEQSVASELELPSLCFPTPNLIVLSVGDHRLVLLHVAYAEYEARLLHWCFLNIDQFGVAGVRGLLLHDAKVTLDAAYPDGKLLVCASSVHETLLDATTDAAASSESASRSLKWKTMFQTHLLTIRLIGADHSMVPGEPAVTLVSNETPLDVGISQDGSRLVVVGTCTFVGPQASAAPAGNAAMSAVAPTSYSWMQTDTDVVVVMTLPAPVLKAHVACRFEGQRVSLNVAGVPVGAFGLAQLMGTVKASDCVWTLENERVLTLYLEKADQFRWSHIFAHDDGVLETVDPSELAGIRERLKALTSSVEGSGLQTPAFDPKALDRTMEECDTDAPSVSIHVFAPDGRCTHVAASGRFDFMCFGLPSQHNGARALGLKLDVDTLVFNIDREAITATHVATLDAFSYVQASKRLRKFVTFVPDGSVALILEATRFLYVYRQSQGRDVHGAQYVLDLDPGFEEEFMGIAPLPGNRLAILSSMRIIVVQY